MTIAWVIGGGGLLGSALRRELGYQGTTLFCLPERLCWDDRHKLIQQFAAAVQAFAVQVVGVDRWEIYWAAGVGTMSSPADALAPETEALSALLSFIKSQPELNTLPGAIALASSAGAIYAGAMDEVISENTPSAPTTAYAHEKLAQEKILSAFAQVNKKAVLIARISTLYGPGQALGKQQGLITHIARCVLRNQPIQIYVPFDTIRDYIIADDAAAEIVSALRAAMGKKDGAIKIIASEQPATIAEIISIYRKIARRTPRIVTSASKLSEYYSRRIQFRSIVVPRAGWVNRTSLHVGIARVIAAERATYTFGFNQ